MPLFRVKMPAGDRTCARWFSSIVCIQSWASSLGHLTAETAERPRMA